MEFNKPNVLNLSGNIADHFMKFKEDVLIYLTATETYKKAKDVQIARLKNLLGSDGIDLYRTLYNGTDIESVDYIIDILEKYYIPKQNMTMNVNKLIARKQHQQEAFENFYADLKRLIKPCCFENQEEKNLKALIVLGINSKQLQEQLLRKVGKGNTLN